MRPRRWTPTGVLRRTGERARLQDPADLADDVHVQETVDHQDLDATGSGVAVEVVPDAIVVRLGVARYAIPMADVAEVVHVPVVTRVPGMPSWLAGVVNWRGHVLPLLDLRPLLSEPLNPLPSSARVVVLTRDGVEAGLVVELVTGLLTPTEEAPLPAPSTASSDAVNLVVGVVDAGGPVSLLDAVAVLELRRSLPSTRRSA